MDEQRKEKYSYSYDESSKGTSQSRSQQTRNYQSASSSFDWELFTSWPFIVGAFMLGVWPLGVFLIIKGMNLDSEKTGKKPSSGSVVTKVDATNVKTTEVKSKTAAKKTKKKSAKKKQHSGSGIWFILGGAIFAFCGLMSLYETMDMIAWANSMAGYIEELWTALTFLAAGCGMLGVGVGQNKQERRFPLYLNVINSRPVVSFAEISSVMGISRRKVVRDLKKMVEKGLLGSGAYLDMGQGCYVASADAAVREEPKPVPEKPVEGYDAILRNIRELNDRIADEQLSAQIDRIEEVSRQIFREVERNPEKEKQISVLMNYYLPTTQKLLDSYATFEEAGVDGQKTAQAKERIETTMERIVHGFEKQLDELYSSDVLDVETDIRVMENMLRRDGADETDELRLRI